MIVIDFVMLIVGRISGKQSGIILGGDKILVVGEEGSLVTVDDMWVGGGGT